MAIELKSTDEYYYLFVNWPELLKRAEELGYKAVMLFLDEEFDKEDREMLRATCKDVIRIVYNPERRFEEGGEYKRLRPRGETYDIVLELSGYPVTKDIYIESLEDAIKYFPTREKLDDYLMEFGVWTRVYPDRMCGNCHYRLGEKEKYCRYCGTERGKGRFLPYRNVSLGVYGPPIKAKFKCSACGHIWIVSTWGYDPSKYCPMCGHEKIKTIEEKKIDFSEWGTE